MALHDLLETLNGAGIIQIVKMLKSNGSLRIVRLIGDLWSGCVRRGICWPSTGQADEDNKQKQSVAGAQAEILSCFQCT